MKKYLKFMLIPLLLAGAFGFYQYNKPHKSIKHATTNYKLSAQTLFTEYESNEETANQKYLDKMIELNGVVKEVKEKDGVVSITLNSDSDLFGVICQLDEHTNHHKAMPKVGENISLKGICTGMLMDVVLVRCIQI